MYGGLFGDLPAARGGGGGGKKDDDKDDKDKKKNNETTKAGTNTPKNPMAMMTMFAPQSMRKKAKTTTITTANSSSSQIAKAVGNAGTSVAFVPTTVKRKRPNRFSKLPPAMPPALPPAALPPAPAMPPTVAPAFSALPPSLSETTPTLPSVLPASGLPEAKQSVAETSSTLPSISSKSATSDTVPQVAPKTFLPTMLSTEETIVDSSSGPVDIHDTGGQAKANLGTEDSHESTLLSNVPFASHHHDAVVATEITDPYDPYVPNDLLQYWDRQSLAKERAQMEREAREALEQQRLLRQRLEMERDELQKKGDFAQILQQQDWGGMGRGRGRGRGRGVSNIPAWLMEKQRQEQLTGP